jgi:vacuolar-type H+-ATPase subunit E/Vma4
MKLTDSQQDLFSNINQAFELVTNVLNQKTDEIDQAESNRTELVVHVVLAVDDSCLIVAVATV